MSRQVTAIPAGAAMPLAAMHAACFPEDPWDAEAIGRIFALSGVFGWLAWEAEEPSGFVLARDLGDEIEIVSLGVLPEMRCRGVGRLLLDAVAGEAARRGIGSIVLEVAEANLAARRLYAGSGFLQVGRRPRYYREKNGAVDALILRCSAIDNPSAT